MLIFILLELVLVFVVIVLLVMVVTVILGVAVFLVLGVTSIAASKCNAYCPYITYVSFS